MRLIALSLLALAVTTTVAHARNLADTCHASSSYDLTVNRGSLLFDRAGPLPKRVTLAQGALTTDGSAVRLNAEDHDRLALFERDLRALVPKVRSVARQAVDIALDELRTEAGGLGLSASTRAEVNRRLSADALALKQRVDSSRSTHDWDGDAGAQYAQQMMGDLAPLVAGDLGQQAVNAALSGDLQTASALRDKAASLATDFQPRLQRRLQVLRPQIQALCPAIDELADLQKGVRASNGQPLHLLQIDK